METVVTILVILIGICAYTIVRIIQLHEVRRLKAKRIKVYKFMLQTLNRAVPNTAMGFCWLLAEASSHINTSPVISDYPELMKYKPGSPYMHNDMVTPWWFDPHNHQLRKDILNRIINNN